MEIYKVPELRRGAEIEVKVPGSKSITNRALLMAAMAQGVTTLKGVLFSADSRVFIQALKDMGFSLQVDEENQIVSIKGQGGSIPKKEAEIYVGSAGTAARFLTAFVAMNDGRYRLESSEQMKKRPMRELVEALRSLGAKIKCLQEEGTFPMEICGIAQKEKEKNVSLNIDRSSQFLSALLMTVPLKIDKLEIELTGTRSARSYVEMTEQMMCQFGHPGVKKISENRYQVKTSAYRAGEYAIEPDISAACYFYAMAAVGQGRAMVHFMRKDSLQGDMKFLKILEKMGCVLRWEKGDLYLQGPEEKLHGIDVDMSDFSDQTLTLAAIAPYADGPVTVRNVAHIRGQECDRIHAICENMKRMKVRCEEREDGFTIYPSQPQSAHICTYDDHRVAMAFTVTGLFSKGIVIENPMCCKKTFEHFYDVLDQVIINNK